ncbi:MAG: DUF5615 family PIN-like protein [Candidatus Xenobia bacterium]
MSELFIRSYLDEDLNVLIATLIRVRGFQAVTTRDAGNLHLDDDEQLAYAVQHQMAMVTHNRVDFEELAKTYAKEGREHFGIVLAIRRSPYEVADRLANLLNRVSAEEAMNQLFFI